MERRNETNKSTPQSTLVKSHFAPVSESVLHYEVQRIKKLVTALYMVTDLLATDEPLRAHIRTYSLDLLRSSHVSQSITAQGLQDHMASIMASIEALMSFVEIAGVARVVSTSNTELLVRELRALHMHMLNRYTTLIGAQADAADDETEIDIAAFLGSFGSNKNEIPPSTAQPRSSVDLGQDTRATEPTKPAPAAKSQPKPSRSLGLAKPTSSAAPAAPAASTRPGQTIATNKLPVYHEHRLDYQKKMKAEAGKKAEPIDPAEEKIHRKERILAIVREKGEASLKDIVIRIASCSEKTQIGRAHV